LVSFVLFILTILLLELFEGFHTQEVEKNMLQVASKISIIVDEHADKNLIGEMTEQVKEPSNKVIIYFPDDTVWISNTTNDALKDVDETMIRENGALFQVVSEGTPFNDKVSINDTVETRVIGIPLKGLS